MSILGNTTKDFMKQIHSILNLTLIISGFLSYKVI